MEASVRCLMNDLNIYIYIRNFRASLHENLLSGWERRVERKVQSSYAPRGVLVILASSLG